MMTWTELTLTDKVSLLNMIEQALKTYDKTAGPEDTFAEVEKVVEEIAGILVSLDVAVTDQDIRGMLTKRVPFTILPYLCDRLARQAPDHFIPFVPYRTL